MTQKKPSLGRGLDALLGQVAARRPAAAAPVATAGSAGEELRELPLDQLQRGQYQPRVDMRPESLEDLAASIKAQGVVQPIIVRPIEMPGSGTAAQRYEIIAGERRWRAARIAGLATIPAVVRRVADSAAIAMALIENIQREDLNPLEEARALDRLIREFGITHQQAADAVGRSRAAVSNLLRLLELSPAVAERVDRREIEMGHARALLGLSNPRQQAEVAELVVKKSLSVRETEALIRRMNNPPSKDRSGDREPTAADPNVSQLQEDLADKLGARVLIQHGANGKGKLVVAYNSLEELDGILGHIR